MRLDKRDQAVVSLFGGDSPLHALFSHVEIDLSRCAAYSDSINDVPMLSAVGRPVAVNPDAALRRTARDRGWEIRDFRTGRKAARIGIPAALGVGAAAGSVAAGLAARRAQQRGQFDRVDPNEAA